MIVHVRCWCIIGETLVVKRWVQSGIDPLIKRQPLKMLRNGQNQQ